MSIYHRELYYIRLLADLIFLNVAYIITVSLVSIFTGIRLEPDTLVYTLILLNITWYATSRSTGLYDEFLAGKNGDEMIAVIKGIVFQSLALTFFLLLSRNIFESTYFIAGYGIFLSLLLLLGKLGVRTLLRHLNRDGGDLRRILIIGATEAGLYFNETIQENRHLGYKVLGFLDDTPAPKLNGQYLGKLKDLEMILERQPVDDVVVTLPATGSAEMKKLINTCDDYFVPVKILPHCYPLLTNKFSVSTFGRFPVVTVRDIDLDKLHHRMLKRAFDFTFSLTVFVLFFSWLWPLIVLGIKITSPGPIFFKQERWGRNNRRMVCFKFRSMDADSTDIDDNGKYLQATKNDPRVTKFGRILRKLNLDELPQFWNVLKGEMSVVGPRPHPTPLNIESKDAVEGYTVRHLVKPGITGWAQVHGYRGETNGNGLMKKRVEHDIWYIENWSLWLDVKIVLLTMWRMIAGDPKAY